MAVAAGNATFNTLPFFLTDGASRSEAPKYYCKWITDDDRNAYDTYLGLHQVNSKANFLYEGFRSICSLNGDVNDIDKLRKTSDKVNDTLFGVAASYSSYDAFDSWGGIYTVTQEIFKKTAESPETRLSDLYTDFFEDEDAMSSSITPLSESSSSSFPESPMLSRSSPSSDFDSTSEVDGGFGVAERSTGSVVVGDDSLA